MRSMALERAYSRSIRCPFISHPRRIDPMASGKFSKHFPTLTSREPRVAITVRADTLSVNTVSSPVLRCEPFSILSGIRVVTLGTSGRIPKRIYGTIYLFLKVSLRVMI